MHVRHCFSSGLSDLSLFCNDILPVELAQTGLQTSTGDRDGTDKALEGVFEWSPFQLNGFRLGCHRRE